MKFYEVQQKSINGQWKRLANFLDKKDAEKYSTLYNTKVEVYPIRVIELEFYDIRDFEEDFL